MPEIIRVQSITEVHNFLGIKKPKHPLVSVLRFGEDIPPLNLLPKDIQYVMDIYQISFKDGISGSMGYGRSSYDFEEGSMVFIAPGQALKLESEEHINNNQGWMLLFHPDLIRKSPLAQTIEDYSFFSYNVNEALHLSEEEQTDIYQLVEKIKKEYSQNIDKHTQKLIIANIELLLDYCNRYYDRQFYTRTNLNKDTVSRFETLLKGYYKSEQHLIHGLPTVKYCANELGMSPNYLSDLLRKETRRNAQDHIHAYIIDRAKTHLLQSSEPISQVAYELGFEYSQHFSRLFKKKTGMSPKSYRNTN